MAKISVIMLTYNRKQFLPRVIKSVLEQSFTDFEYIIVDNGSSDGSGELCRELTEGDSRVKIIQRTKGNIGSGRNAGLDIATGEYITFIDDDDYCMPDYLEFLYNLIVKHSADIALCGSYKEEEGELLPNGNYLYKELYVLDSKQAVENYLWRRLYNCAMPTKLIKKELFDKIKFPNIGNYDDITTAYKYFANAKKVVAQGEPKYVFYRHEGNNSSAATKHYLLNPKQLDEYIQAFRDRTEYISDVLPELTALSRYSEWSYMISMIEKIHRYELNECKEVLLWMKKEVYDNLDEFMSGGFILDFEKEWIEKYINNI